MPSASAWLLAALTALDVALLGAAIAMGDGVVRDGAGSVTTGYNLAFAIAATLVAVLAVRWLPVAPGLRIGGQIYGLAAIALHAVGHLLRLYYSHRWYDDALHVGLLVPASVLAVRLAQGARLFPSRHATPVRAAFLALLSAVALAAVWEVFEFSMDQLQGTREQDDLIDTMQDIIDGIAGGGLAALWMLRHPKPPLG